MKNKTISLKARIACAAAVLAVMLSIFFPLTSPAQAREMPAETISVSQPSDIENGYDAGTSDIGYVIEAPVF